MMLFLFCLNLCLYFIVCFAHPKRYYSYRRFSFFWACSKKGKTIKTSFFTFAQNGKNISRLSWFKKGNVLVLKEDHILVMKRDNVLALQKDNVLVLSTEASNNYKEHFEWRFHDKLSVHQ